MIKIGLTDHTPVNKLIDIRNKNQVIKAKYAIGADDILKYTLMTEHYIEISFSLNKYVAFKRSDYIEWEGDKYILREDYQPEQISKYEYQYTLKFEAIEMFFQDIQFYYLNQGLKESEWSLTGNPEYFLKIAVDNINRYFKTTEYKLGTVEPSEIKFITFELNTNVFDALTQIADEYGAEWYMEGKTIHFLNKVSFGDEVDFETDVSVLSMQRQEGESGTRYTRIVPLGSTRNIPKDYRETTPDEAVDAVYPKRLRIPASKGDVIDAYPNMSPDEVVEGTVIFDEVYPRREGTIEAVGAIEYTQTDEDTGTQTKWNAYKIKDSGINFKEEYLLPGEELRLQFVSGDMNGMNFALYFHKDGFSDTDKSQYFEIVRNEDYGKPLPNNILKPKAGDQYVLYGFNIALVSDQYVPAGELELFDTATEWMQNQLKDTSVYECPTVIKHFMDHQMDLGIGQKVKLIKDVGSNRNILKNTAFKSDTNTWQPLGGYTLDTNTVKPSTSNENSLLVTTSAVGNASNSFRTTPAIPLVNGKTYTLSFWAAFEYESAILHFEQHGGAGFINIPLSANWKYYTHTFTVNNTPTLQLLYFWVNKVGRFRINNIQLEEGNKATLWSEAPEDIDGAIRSSRIMGFEKKLNNKFDAIYTVGDNSTYSRLANIEKEIKELQVAGVVYEATGSNGVYIIKQFDSTRPTDSNVYSAKASDAKYFNKQTGGTVQDDALFLKNVQVQGKNISDVFQNSTFTAGQLGSGFQIKRDANGQSYIEVDNILVRREAVFNRLTIAEIKSVGGTILLSLANMLVSKVEVKTSTWKCFFDTADGTIPNDFAVGDQAICRKLTGKNIKYYWALVTAVGADYIELSKTDKDGSGIPAIGDEVVQLGNRTDINRQYAIMLSAYGSTAPSINQYAGINSYDLTGKEVTTISPKGNQFKGSFIVSTNGTDAPIYKERAAFVNGTVYYLNDRVSYLGSYWVCIVNTTITTPSEGSSTWRKDTVGQTDVDKVEQIANDAQKEAEKVRTEYKADFVIMDTKIASKVSQAAFDALGNRVTTTESNITQLAGSITSVVEKVENIKIGGVNLVSNLSINWKQGAYLNTDGSYMNLPTYICIINPIDAKPNTTYITSVKEGYIINVHERKEDGTFIRSTSGIFTTSSETKKFTFNITKRPSDNINPLEVVNVYFQIEEGNKPTNWKPSQGDIQSGIDNAQNTADSKNRTYYQDVVPTAPSGGHKVGDLWHKESLVDSSGNINADTTKNIYQLQYRWDGTIWKQINWSVARSKIEQTDSSIGLLVEKTGINSVGAGSSLFSMIQLVPDQIKLEVSKVQVGGVNLCSNTDVGIDGITSAWLPWKGTIYHLKGNYIRLVRSQGTSTDFGIQSPLVLGGLKKGKEYTVSFEIGSYYYTDLFRYNYIMSSVGNKALNVPFSINSSTTELQYKYFTFKADKDYPDARIMIGTLTGSDTNSGQGFTIRNFQIEEGNKPTAWKSSPEDTQAGIDKAQQTADAAQTLYNEISDDNRLTPNEKQLAKKDWDNIISEYPKNTAEAQKFGVSTTAYSSAYNTLNTYITPVLADLTTTSIIIGTTFRQRFNDYHKALTDLLNGISSKAKEIADSKTTIDEVKAGLKITADGIEAFGEKFTINSLLIAKAIEAGGLVVKDGNFTVARDGSIKIAQGAVAFNPDGSGVIGQFKLEDGRLIGYKDGIERVQLTTDVIGSRENLLGTTQLYNNSYDDYSFSMDINSPTFTVVDVTQSFVLSSGDTIIADMDMALYLNSGSKSPNESLRIYVIKDGVTIATADTSVAPLNYTITQNGTYSIRFHAYMTANYNEVEFTRGTYSSRFYANKVASARKSILASDGFASVWDETKWILISATQAYFIDAKGKIRLSSPNGQHSITIDDTGIKLEGLKTARSGKDYLYRDSSGILKQGV